MRAEPGTGIGTEASVFAEALQTWKMLKILPEQDCSFQDFTRKCVNYVNVIATKLL